MNKWKKIALMPIKFYKACINPLLMSNCKYTPSCSAYMSQAIVKRGFVTGFGLGVYRLLRCNHFSKGGFDPVKNDYKGKAKWVL